MSPQLAFEANSFGDGGPLPLPEGEGGEGLRSLDSIEPPHPNPLPCGERERTRRVDGFAHLMKSNNPLFDRLGLIGTGLIGSSIAHAARAQGVVREIVATAH